MPPSLSLAGLSPGLVARVAGFGALSPEVSDRLVELGFDEGAEVETLHRAPLGGDPIAVRVDGTLVALRRAVADHILIFPPENLPPEGAAQ